MIQGDFEEYCQECPELYPIAVKLYADDSVCMTIISCEHKELCRKIYERILKEKDDDGI